MTETTLIAIWLVAASLTFFAGVIAIVAIGVGWIIHEDRLGSGRRAGRTRHDACRHGCEIERRVDGPTLRTIHHEEPTRWR